MENGGMDDLRAIEDLRRLVARDEELGIRERRLQEFDAIVRRIRERSEAMQVFFARYEEARRRGRTAIEGARGEVTRRQHEVAAAETTLAAERDEARRELARRAVARAEDHLSVAGISLARAQADAERLEQEAQDWQEELPELEQDAHRLSPDLPDVGQPAPGAQALVDWAAHAHAPLFVAVRQIEAERERVIREANELASALLAEPTYGTTPAQALARVEQRVA